MFVVLFVATKMMSLSVIMNHTRIHLYYVIRYIQIRIPDAVEIEFDSCT